MPRSSYHVIAAADLKKLIRRTIFATDVESTRYALGGVLVELIGESIAMVGTDGRRLARMSGAGRSREQSTGPDRFTGDSGQGSETDRTQFGR